MFKKLFVVAAVTVLSVVGTAQAQYPNGRLTDQYGFGIGSYHGRSDGNYAVRDQFGFDRATLKPRFNGGYSINDNFGFQRGSLREQPLGRYSINDNFGFQRGYAQPRSNGYQIFGGW